MGYTETRTRSQLEENGEELFGSIDDDDELDKVYNYYMQEIFADEDEDSDDGAEE